MIALLASAGPAHADGEPILVDDDYAVEMSFDDGTTASPTLINPSASDLVVVASPVDPNATCNLSFRRTAQVQRSRRLR
jgi:hypothetical protein